MDVLTQAFFNKGAFITDFETGDIIMGQGGEVTEVPDFDPSTPAFYLKDFYLDKYLCYRPSVWQRFSRAELIKSLNETETQFTITQVQNKDDVYAEDFNNLKSAFNSHLQKVVLISREEFKVSDSLAARKSFFKKALTFGAGLPYGLWFEGYGVVGSTPEILYQIKEQAIYTFALAGTGIKGQEKELLSSAKDRHEHDLVVDDIKEKLTPFCESVENLPTELTHYKDIIHLKTEIKGRLKAAVNLKALTSNLSPTAALGGYPKISALTFLRYTKYGELHPKRFFGSALGVINKDFKQFVVSIRNIQWEDELFFIESGGGVLPESNLDKELEEIKLKRNTIKKHYL